MTRLGRAEEFRRLAAIETDECVLWPYAHCRGYGNVWIDGRVRYTHRVALTLRTGEHPDLQAAHGPCVSTRCMNYRHLSWKDHAGNAADRERDGTQYRGEAHHAAKLTEADVMEIKANVRTGVATQAAEARRLGVDPSVISDIMRSKLWRWVP